VQVLDKLPFHLPAADHIIQLKQLVSVAWYCLVEGLNDKLKQSLLCDKLNSTFNERFVDCVL